MDIHWTQYISAFMTPIIAITALYIAFMQWKLASNKFKLDLFDKRYIVYKACMRIIAQLMTNGNTSQLEQSEFLRDTSDAKWLLSREIDSFISDTIWKTIVDIETLCTELDPKLGFQGSEEERKNMIRDRADKKIFIVEQRKKINELFEPFLSIQHQS